MQPLPPGKVIYDKLPNITWHGNKYIRVGPDERLYIDLGAPCNDCLLQNAVGNVSYGSLNSMRLDGTDLQPVAGGVYGGFLHFSLLCCTFVRHCCLKIETCWTIRVE